MTSSMQPRLKTSLVNGFSVRGWRNDADYAAVSEVINTSMANDGLDFTRDEESIRNYLTHWPNLDRRLDMFLVEQGNRAVAYGDATWGDESSGARVYRTDLYLLPEVRGTGLLEALFHVLVDRLTAIAMGHPKSVTKLLQSVAASTEDELIHLIQTEGLKPARHFFRMVRPTLEDIPELPLPPGLDVRAVKPEHYRAIHEAKDEAFRDHWGHRPATEASYQHWLENPEFQPHLWQVAWDGDQVAGMVLNFIDASENERYHRARGYTEDISVRRPWRRRGLARALIASSLKVLAEAGMNEAGLGVDSENPSGALTLYESLGYRTTWQWAAYRKPFDV